MTRPSLAEQPTPDEPCDTGHLSNLSEPQTLYPRDEDGMAPSSRGAGRGNEVMRAQHPLSAAVIAIGGCRQEGLPGTAQDLGTLPARGPMAPSSSASSQSGTVPVAIPRTSSATMEGGHSASVGTAPRRERRSGEGAPRGVAGWHEPPPPNC